MVNPVSLQRTEDHTSKTCTCCLDALKYDRDSLNYIGLSKSFFHVFFQNIASFCMRTLELNQFKSNQVTFTLEKAAG